MADVLNKQSAKTAKAAKLVAITPEAPVQLGVPTASVVADAAPIAIDLPAPVAVEPVPAAAAPVAALTQGKSAMNDTIHAAQDSMNTVQDTMTAHANDATAKASAFFGDVTDRTKTAVEKGTKAIEEIVEFSKGNLEAVVASGRVVAKGAEEIARYSADYGRSTIETANANAKRFAGVKSPTEFFQLQGEIAKQTLDAIVAEGSKFTENYLKLMGEVAQPISNRVSIAADKVKTTVAA